MTENKLPETTAIEPNRKRNSICLGEKLDHNRNAIELNFVAVGERICYDQGGFRKMRRATETFDVAKGKSLYEISNEDDFGLSSTFRLSSEGRRPGGRRSSAFTPKTFWEREESLRPSNSLDFTPQASRPDYYSEQFPQNSSWGGNDFWNAPVVGPPIKQELHMGPSYYNQSYGSSEVPSSDGSNRKGAWTLEEDRMLMCFCGEEETKNWTEIAANIPGRTAKQCRERWCFNLDPSINKELWAPSEDQMLVQKQEEIGNKWAQIATLLPGRTENAVKTRYKSIVRAQKREWKPSEDELLLSLHKSLGPNWESIAKELEAHRTKHAVKMRFKELQVGLIQLKLPEYGSAKQTVRELYYPRSTLFEISERYRKLAGEEAKPFVTEAAGAVHQQNPTFHSSLPKIPSFHHFSRGGLMNMSFSLSRDGESFDQTFDDFYRVMCTEEDPLVLA